VFAHWRRGDIYLNILLNPIDITHENLSQEVAPIEAEKPSIVFCIDDNICNSNGQYSFLVKEGNRIILHTGYNVEVSNISAKSYLHINYKDTSHKLYMFDMHNDTPFYENKIPDINGNIVPWTKIETITYDNIKNAIEHFEADEYCLYDDMYIDNNLVATYENGDEFIFSCANGGNHYNVYKKIKGSYHEFNILDTNIQDSIEDMFINGNSIKRFHYDDYNRSTINLTNSSGLWHCGIDYSLAYNGNAFIIESIKIMPLCMNIEKQHWINLYKK